MFSKLFSIPLYLHFSIFFLLFDCYTAQESTKVRVSVFHIINLKLRLLIKNVYIQYKPKSNLLIEYKMSSQTNGFSKHTALVNLYLSISAI